jgi:hypothetical protein
MGDERIQSAIVLDQDSCSSIRCHSYNSMLSPVWFTKSGDIIGIDGRARLVKYNDKGQLLGYHSYRYFYSYERGLQVVMYTESLLSLPNKW